MLLPTYMRKKMTIEIKQKLIIAKKMVKKMKKRMMMVMTKEKRAAIYVDEPSYSKNSL